jgi:hypothetical protein
VELKEFQTPVMAFHQKFASCIKPSEEIPSFLLIKKFSQLEAHKFNFQKCGLMYSRNDVFFLKFFSPHLQEVEKQRRKYKDKICK